MFAIPHPIASEDEPVIAGMKAMFEPVKSKPPGIAFRAPGLQTKESVEGKPGRSDGHLAGHAPGGHLVKNALARRIDNSTVGWRAAALVVAVVSTWSLSGCAHHLEFNDSQQAAVSPQAAAFIATSTYVSAPSFLPITDGALSNARTTYDDQERAIEDKIIDRYGLKVDHTSVAGVPVVVITPKVVKPDYERKIAFNVHGGAFFLGTARERSALLMAANMGIRVYSVEYSLAPAAKFPRAIDECLDVYKNLVAQFGPSNMVAMSFSAGGEIMLATLLKAGHDGIPLPKAQVLFSPAADLSLTGDSKTANDQRDILSVGFTSRIVKYAYLGDASDTQPTVSPLYSSFPANFPPTMMVTGTRDFLLSDSVRLHWKLMAVGVRTELLVGEGMWHGFAFEYETPESAATMKEVVRFLDDQLHAK